MRVPNDGGGAGPAGPFGELLRLQADFQTLLTEETLKYLRRVQGTLGPAIPGTVLMPDPTLELRAAATASGSVELQCEIENRQRVHCLVTPLLTPLVDAAGATWFPAAELSPNSVLLPPDGLSTLSIRLPVPSELPPGTYRGMLVLQGFRDGGVPITVVVAAPSTNHTTSARAPSARTKRRTK